MATKKKLDFRIEYNLAAELKKVAEEMNVTQSELIRNVITTFVSNKGAAA